jgi:hypothetical protein
MKNRSSSMLPRIAKPTQKAEGNHFAVDPQLTKSALMVAGLF